MDKKTAQKKIEFLEGPIWNKLPLYALPVAATGILEQLFNASDIAIVGNFASTDKTTAIAAVGANSPIIGMILNLFIGISLGTNVIIANAIGRKDKEAVENAVHTSVLLALLGGLVVLLAGELCIESVLRLLNVPADVFPSALLYIRIYLLGMPMIFLYNFEAAIFRSVGDTKIPLQALALSGVLNVILNLVFVILFHMTVNGVAIATVLSNTVSSLLLLFRLMRSDKWIRLNLKKVRLHKSSLSGIVKIGFPAGIQSAVFNLANIVIQSAINSLGTIVIAASSAAYNIEIFVYYIFNSFSQACTTFVGQNYGAGQLKRCRRILALSLIEDTITCILAIFLILFSGHFLLSLFNRDPQVIALGYTRLLMIFTAYIFSMLYEVMSGYLRGFGISLVPAILTIIGVCGIRILWVYTVFPQHRTFAALMTAYPVSLFTTALLILAALLFYRPSHRLSGPKAEA